MLPLQPCPGAPWAAPGPCGLVLHSQPQQLARCWQCWRPTPLRACSRTDRNTPPLYMYRLLAGADPLLVYCLPPFLIVACIRVALGTWQASVRASVLQIAMQRRVNTLRKCASGAPSSSWHCLWAPASWQPCAPCSSCTARSQLKRTTFIGAPRRCKWSRKCRFAVYVRAYWVCGSNGLDWLRRTSGFSFFF